MNEYELAYQKVMIDPDNDDPISPLWHIKLALWRILTSMQAGGQVSLDAETQVCKEHGFKTQSERLIEFTSKPNHARNY